MTALVPFQRDAIREAAHRALWRLPDGSDREFSEALGDAVFAEAEVVADLFSPAAGYLTSDEQLDEAIGRAVERILHNVRSEIETTFADELSRTPAPEFTAPRAGSWIARRSSIGIGIGTWHRVSGRLRTRAASCWGHREWPEVVTSCGQSLSAWFRDDGSPVWDWIVVEDEPVVACGRCRRYPLREVVPA